MEKTLLAIDEQLKVAGIEGTLEKASNLLGEHPINYMKDISITLMHTAPELIEFREAQYKERVANVLNAMSLVTLDHWTEEYMKDIGPVIFKPLLEIINN